jgi:hypothetical protein
MKKEIVTYNITILTINKQYQHVNSKTITLSAGMDIDILLDRLFKQGSVGILINRIDNGAFAVTVHDPNDGEVRTFNENGYALWHSMLKDDLQYCWRWKEHYIFVGGGGVNDVHREEEIISLIKSYIKKQKKTI